ncbi:hypothetical protein KQI84_01995 [bacterium]|nr:hypothetical protein [bacterium]
MTGLVLDTAALAGRNDHPHYESGWHERERDGRCGVVYRAGRKESVLRLRRREGAKRLCLLISGPRGLVEDTLRGTLQINESCIDLELDADVWTIREVELPEDESDELRVLLTLPGAPCPDEVLHNGDPRRLGWFLSAAWQE